MNALICQVKIEKPSQKKPQVRISRNFSCRIVPHGSDFGKCGEKGQSKPDRSCTHFVLQYSHTEKRMRYTVSGTVYRIPNGRIAYI